jgi:hypothetical protein
MEIMVFKTSVETQESVVALSDILDKAAGCKNWNFALDDCDRILRIASAKIDSKRAVEIMNANGFDCFELE